MPLLLRLPKVSTSLRSILTRIWPRRRQDSQANGTSPTFQLITATSAPNHNVDAPNLSPRNHSNTDVSQLLPDTTVADGSDMISQADDDASSVLSTETLPRSRVALQAGITLLNLALPISEVFTPLKAAIGTLLESAKFLDQRHSNIDTLEHLVLRADDLIKVLSNPQGVTSQYSGWRSSTLNNMSEDLTKRIKKVNRRLKRVEKMNSIQISAISSILASAMVELDRVLKNLIAFLKEEVFTGPDTLSEIHRKLLDFDDKEPLFYIYSASGLPAMEGANVSMFIVKRVYKAHVMLIDEEGLNPSKRRQLIIELDLTVDMPITYWPISGKARTISFHHLIQSPFIHKDHRLEFLGEYVLLGHRSRERGWRKLLKERSKNNPTYWLLAAPKPVLPGTISLQLGLRSNSLTIVTSMWNTIWSLQAMKRADDHFSQLQDVIWKDEIEGGARIVKSHNTHASALDILNEIPTSAGISDDSFRLHGLKSMISPFLLSELLARIQDTRQELSSIAEDRIQLVTTNSDSHLNLSLVSSFNEAIERSARFVDQMVEFGTLNPPPGLDVNPLIIAYDSLCHVTLLSQHYIQALNTALSQLTPHTWANRERRSELRQLLKSAQTDFDEDYDRLCKFGPPPPGCDPFIPSIVPSSAGILQRTERAFRSILMKESKTK
ncbi:hypothetical protein CVT24_006391 [Panaeolus cyanescens]|uniref:Uncharacterized protein n=1 Tax=Panaeolus cyanescens TaxID=181874 RepID=A0A409WBU8_9AGAR|nr:hypothetical protein CVT24_006391 [Panaeolus cyanescens]